MPAPLPVQALVEGQFSLIGCWQLDQAASLVLVGAAPDIPGVYAFAMNGMAQYVGVASASLAKRLYFYRKPGPTQTTNVRMNTLLREELASGSCIDIYVATPPALEWNGWSVSGPEGLEAGIIKTYVLHWNLRGASPPRVSAAAPPEALSARPGGAAARVETVEAAAMTLPSEQAHSPRNLAPTAPRQSTGGKYLALCDFLRSCQQDKVSMTFARIEQLVGPLPKSAASRLGLVQAAVPVIEGFRAPIGVLNPDMYDPRIGMR
jgi:hypothetical protein